MKSISDLGDLDLYEAREELRTQMAQVEEQYRQMSQRDAALTKEIGARLSRKAEKKQNIPEKAKK